MRTIHVLSGLPASGKSTFAATQKHTIISRDIFRDAVRRACNSQNYFPVSAAKEWELWSGHLNSFLITHPSQDITIDQTTISYGALEKLVNSLFLTLNDAIVVHIFDIPFEICLARNNTRIGMTKVDLKTMRSMHESFTKRGITQSNIGPLSHTATLITHSLDEGR